MTGPDDDGAEGAGSPKPTLPGQREASGWPATDQPATGQPNQAAGPDGDEQRTVFMPSPPPGQLPAEPPAAPPAPPPASAEPPASFGQTMPPGQTTMAFAASGGQPRQVQVGDVLNHLYAVRRFIARGGMGEVFEGVNINSEDERVAIKVILPHLASDPNVLAMFRKEARTLTRLSHPALVQYRTLAQEPQLGVFYIVTEYIDGRNMSDVLATLKPGVEELAALIRRLAEGLAVAHGLGAIHRDISPDNVMLEGGRLDGARIIDFGIAKDLDAGSQTIIGDGFAGKLNYVAPEQLGDFDRAVGPWTDVYSLGLTILAVINGRDVNMGGSLVDAVDKRRAGPDLGQVPPPLRGVLEGMLRPDPQDRFRSMEAVIAALAAPPGQPLAGSAGHAPPAPPSVRGQTAASDAARPSGATRRNGLILAGGLGAVALLGGLVWALWPQDADQAPAPVASASVPARDMAATAQAALQQGLPRIDCAWLELADIQVSGNDVALALRGLAGDPARAQAEIGKLLEARGLRAASLDASEVSPINPADCGPLSAFRQIRAEGPTHIRPLQPRFEMGILPDIDPKTAGMVGATAVLELDLSGIDGEFALIGIEDNGDMAFIGALTRAMLDQPGSTYKTARPGIYRLELQTTHKGWSGIVLLTGRPPYDPALFTGSSRSRGSDWPERFLAAARAQGWTAEMVWYQSVDELPNAAGGRPAG